MTRLSLAISLVTQANEGCGVMAGTVPWAISAQSESRIGSIPAGVGDTPKLQPLQGRMRNQQEDKHGLGAPRHLAHIGCASSIIAAADWVDKSTDLCDSISSALLFLSP